MELSEFLDILEEVEDRMAMFYDLAMTSHIDDKEAVEFFSILKAEEIAHRELVKLEKKALANVKDYDAVRLEELATGFKDKIAELDLLLISASSLSLEEAVETAYDLETSVFDQHHAAAMQHVRSKSAEFFNKVGASDSLHIQRILDFARKRSLDCLKNQQLSTIKI